MVWPTWEWSHLGSSHEPLLGACHSIIDTRLSHVPLPGRSRRHFAARPNMSSRIHSSRLFLIAASLMALGGLIPIQSAVAAASTDPRIYSAVPFAFQADRGIFSQVPDQQVDARIFPPVSNSSDTHVQKSNPDRERVRYDL